MFDFRQLKELFRFLSELKNRGFRSYLELAECKVFIEFEIDEFKYLEKYIKDWLLFHSDVVSAYEVEWTDDDVCRFNLFLNKGEEF